MRLPVYAIGTANHETFGHGDFGTVVKIEPMGAYGTGKFPPVFTSRRAAEAWIEANKWRHQKVVVELEVVWP